eukprot:781728-Prorocentrum_minimum.AAC.2
MEGGERAICRGSGGGQEGVRRVNYLHRWSLSRPTLSGGWGPQGTPRLLENSTLPSTLDGRCRN